MRLTGPIGRVDLRLPVFAPDALDLPEAFDLPDLADPVWFPAEYVVAAPPPRLPELVLPHLPDRKAG